MSADEVERAIERYKEGATLREVAAEFGVHRYTVAEHLERRGISRRMKGLTPEQLVKATELYGDGWSFTQVAEEIGANRSTIRRALLAAGVAIRPRFGWSYD